MKRPTIFSFLICLCVCAIVGSVTATPTTGTIKGNGTKLNRHYKATPFKTLDCSTYAKIEVVSGANYSVDISGDENIVNLIQVKIKNGTLRIAYDRDNITINQKVEVTITMPTALSNLNVSGQADVELKVMIDHDYFYADISGMGMVKAENVMTNKLKIDNSGMGNISITGTCTDLEVDNSGMGKIDLKELNAENVKCNNSGMGKVDVYASSSAIINCSGMGAINYYGNPDKVKTDCSGMGKVSSK